MHFGTYNRTCAALPASFKTVQWRGAHVWKVGTPDAFKMFAIGTPPSEADDAPCPITLKVGEAIYPSLMELDGVRRAPHLPSGGWICVDEPSAIDDETLAHHIRSSYELATRGLTRRVRAELGLDLA